MIYVLNHMNMLCVDHTHQIQQSLLVASQYRPGLSETVGGSQEDECHRLGRENPGAGQCPPGSGSLMSDTVFMLIQAACVAQMLV